MAQLKQDGYCLIGNVAGESLLNRTRACVDKALAEVDTERLAKTKAPGSLIDSDNYPELADLIGNRRALEELERMGFDDVKFWKAVIISKPPGGPRLYWHQDCLMWQDPRAYSDRPPMIFPHVLSRGHRTGKTAACGCCRARTVIVTSCMGWARPTRARSTASTILTTPASATTPARSTCR